MSSASYYHGSQFGHPSPTFGLGSMDSAHSPYRSYYHGSQLGHLSPSPTFVLGSMESTHSRFSSYYHGSQFGHPSTTFGLGSMDSTHSPYRSYYHGSQLGHPSPSPTFDFGSTESKHSRFSTYFDGIPLPSNLPNKRVLYVYLSDRFEFWSFPVLSLLYHDLTCYYHSLKASSVKVPRWMSCVLWKNWLYCMGGREYTEVGQIYTSRVMRFLVRPPPECIGYDTPDPRAPMHSGKGVLCMAVEKNDIIYVLSGIFNQLKPPEHTFEAYDVKRDRWHILETPPFHLSRFDIDNPRGDLRAYIVTPNMIYVSTLEAAFQYDINANRWGPCYLFSTPDCTARPAFMGGPSFDFDGPGIFYQENYLIGFESNQGAVVGYHIDSGVVLEKEYLLNLPYLGKKDRNRFGRLVDLGNGYFCMTYTVVDCTTILYILTFKVWKSIEAYNDKFLSELCSLRVIGVVASADYSPLESFAV